MQFQDYQYKMKQYTLKVHEIRKETEDAITLCFKQPGLRKIKYLAGQYITLQFRINGRRYSRPYSFSSAPVVDNLLEITIKRVAEGIVSNYIHDQVQIGDVIEVLEPMGDFVFDYSEEIETIFFWGVGSGITPLISLIKDILNKKPFVKIHLVYGNKNFDTTLFSELIDKLAVLHSKKFFFTHFHTQTEMNEEHSSVKKGRIRKDFILDLVKETVISKTRHYICGPTNLKNKIKETLVDLKYPLVNIFSEDFELVRDPKDFNDIVNRKVKISFEGVESLVEVVKGKSVLEAALDAAIELPYSCQTGNCSTCKAKLKEGELRMIGLTKERDDLESGDYLLCCSHPLTDNVCIQI